MLDVCQLRSDLRGFSRSRNRHNPTWPDPAVSSSPTRIACPRDDYHLLDSRTGRRSTALATNIEFQAWADYLGDPPLATAFLDCLVDGAVILKLTGRSYRAHRSRPVGKAGDPDSP
jgi:hypothetical protein